MKKFLIFSFFVAVTFVFGQNFQAAVKRDFDNYLQLISNKKVSEALDYANPKLFDLVPREQMQKAMESVYNMPGMEYKTFPPQYVSFDDLKKIDKIDYVRFHIISPIEMKFEDIDGEKDQKIMIALQNKFGAENVNYNKETGFYKINSQKIIVASSVDNLKNWKFVTVENTQTKSLLSKVIPAEFLD